MSTACHGRAALPLSGSMVPSFSGARRTGSGTMETYRAQVKSVFVSLLGDVSSRHVRYMWCKDCQCDGRGQARTNGTYMCDVTLF